MTDTEMRTANGAIALLANAGFTCEVCYPKIQVESKDGRCWDADVDSISDLATGIVSAEKDYKPFMPSKQKKGIRHA